MKSNTIVFGILILVLFALGCSSNKAAEKEISFDSGIEQLKSIDSNYTANEDFDWFAAELADFGKNLSGYKNTRDMLALKEIVDIRLSIAKSQISLDKGIGNNNTCETFNYLQMFTSNATSAVNQIQSFMNHYPELINQTMITSETIDTLNANVAVIDEMISSSEYTACQQTKAI